MELDPLALAEEHRLARQSALLLAGLPLLLAALLLPSAELPLLSVEFLLPSVELPLPSAEFVLLLMELL